MPLAITSSLRNDDNRTSQILPLMFDYSQSSAYSDVDMKCYPTSSVATQPQHHHPVNSVVLASCSPVLCRVLSGLDVSVQPLVILDQVAEPSLDELLQLLYTGTLEKSHDNGHGIEHVLRMLAIDSDGRLHLMHQQRLTLSELSAGPLPPTDSCLENEPLSGRRAKLNRIQLNDITTASVEIKDELETCFEPEIDLQEEEEEPKSVNGFENNVIAKSTVKSQRHRKQAKIGGVSEKLLSLKVSTDANGGDVKSSWQSPANVVATDNEMVIANHRQKRRTSVAEKRASKQFVVKKETVSENGLDDKEREKPSPQEVDETSSKGKENETKKRGRLRLKPLHKLKRLRAGERGGKYQCTMCSDTFQTIRERNDHKTAHEGLLPQCDICEKVLKNLNSLQQHRFVQHGKRRHQCDICPASFKVLNHLSIHKNKHFGISPFFCEKCNKTFSDKYRLTEHTRIHDEDNPYKCEVCNKIFTRKRFLDKHACGDKPKPYICSTCGKGFQEKNRLDEHSKLHTGEKLFQCQECKKTFCYRSSYKLHLLLHNDKKYICDLCGKKFFHQGNLKYHVSTHTEGGNPKKFMCTVCGQGFTSKGGLVKHTRIHTGERPYACEICPKRFRDGSTLANHMVYHSGIRKFECTICNQKFFTRGNLADHLPTHTGEKPFSCAICNDRFKSSSLLAHHKRTHNRDLANSRTTYKPGPTPVTAATTPMF